MNFKRKIIFSCLLILRKILLILPLPLNYVIGRLLGLLFYFNSKTRTNALVNIKLCFPEKNFSWIKRVAQASFNNLGLSIVETLISPRLKDNIEISCDHLPSKEVILVGIHQGSWEIYNYYFAKKVPFCVLIKQQKVTVFSDFINYIRKLENMHITSSMKTFINYIKAGYAVGMVVDHGLKKGATFLNFFNHYVPTPQGAVMLAKKFNLPLYPCFGYRVKKFKHRVIVHNPLFVEERNPYDILQELNNIYERDLKNFPFNYLWHYKRFKRRKDIDVVFFDDNKIGHRKQGQSLLALIRQLNPYARLETVKINYKGKYARLVCEVLSLLAPKDCFSWQKFFKLFLTRDSYEKITKIRADISINVGSYLAPLNVLFSLTQKTKAISILRPNTSYRKFSLIILPEHDRIEADNIVKIKGAFFEPSDISSKIKAVKEFFHIKESKKISLFVGGPLLDREEYFSSLKVFVEKLKRFILNDNFSLLLSTSRRTPPEIDDYLHKTFSNFPLLEAACFPNKKNYDFVFEGFTGLSDIVLVTADSISMISEILTLRKVCLPVVLEKLEGKHKLFLQSLSSDIDIIREPFQIKVSKTKIPCIYKENKDIIRQALVKLL